MILLDREEKNGLLKWTKANEKDLPSLIPRSPRQWLQKHRLEIPPLALNQTEAGRRDLIRCIYEVLCRYEIDYAIEPPSDDKRIQWIRTPWLILENPREGTCLDLSLLFCGLCIDCGLIPWIVLLEGHAYSLVSLEHSLDQVEVASRNPILRLFDKRRVVSDPEEINKLVESVDGRQRFAAVECTGFVRARGISPNLPEGMGRDARGFLAFEQALEIGANHLRNGPRKLACAIDVGVAFRIWGATPYTLESQVNQPQPTTPPPMATSIDVQELGVLPYLCDRVEQTDEVSNLVLDAIVQEFSRPLVLLIPGGQSQHHSGLIRRLADYDIPRAMSSPEDEPAVTPFAFDLPPVDTQQFDLRLRRSLAKKISRKNPSPTWEQITAELRSRSGPTLVHTTFDTSHWHQDRQQNFDRIEALLRSWESCGNLPCRSAVIVCVQIVIEDPAVIDPDPGPEILRYLDALSKRLSTGEAFPNIVARGLKPLDDVRRVHLDAWSSDELVREFSGEHDFTHEVNELFTENHKLPMSRVFPKLQDWLKLYSGRS